MILDMEMQKHISLLVLYALGFLSSLKFGSANIVGVYRNGSCIQSEKQALLLLKQTLDDHSNYLSSWVGDDCCAWHGIGCNNITGHVMQLDLQNGQLRGRQISPSLPDLKYLAYLDLSGNSFNKIQIPEFFGLFKHLIYLDLSRSSFCGLVPHHLGNLSKLLYLNLSSDYYAHYEYGSTLSIDSMGWLSKLSLLEHLDLFSVNLSRVNDLPFTNLTSLISLVLSGNQLHSSFPLWVLNNIDLVHLNLMDNYFNGPIPKSIGSLGSLSELYLSNNNFEGYIPHSIGNLSSLSDLSLANNKLNDLPPEIGNLTQLSFLSLGSNELRGGIKEEICKISKLEILEVGGNQLSGSIPKCIGELSNLITLDLSSNSWEGFVSEHHFVNLTRLVFLHISSKSTLEWNTSSRWLPPFQLKYLYIESLSMGPKFPQWLITQGQIINIWMTNTRVSDSIPTDWFVNVLLSHASVVNLSNNDINGDQLSPILAAPNSLMLLALSNNRLSGEFPTFLCHLTSLAILDLSNNNFSGELPQCLGNLTHLRVLNVMSNSLSGDIPESLGSLRILASLNLHNNKFQGKLPLSFQHLKELIILDLGNNNLSDILPVWTGKQLPYLRHLILQSNNFFGDIPTQLCHHSLLRVLNLAQNQIRGSIPACFINFSSMITSDRNDHYPGFTMTNGKMIIDVNGFGIPFSPTIGLLISIDLSNNNISGEIPEELMDLHGLLNLNLSSNHLVGRIPEKIGKLDKLECLDLSKNELDGSVPQSLSDLNFLRRLNLSFNNFSGRIPTGNQLQTLDDSTIYVGNDQLCGGPNLKPCPGDTQSNNFDEYNQVDSSSENEYEWLNAGIGPGFLVGFLGFCASLHFIKSWRYYYFQFLEQVFDKIAAANTLLQRKF